MKVNSHRFILHLSPIMQVPELPNILLFLINAGSAPDRRDIIFQKGTL
jgi:hypothetical protein